MTDSQPNLNSIKMGLDLMHLLGESLVKDDIGDLGMMSYIHNHPRFYRGELLTTPHPEAIHHWMFGSAMMQASELLSLGMKAMEFIEDLKLSNSTITLLDKTFEDCENIDRLLKKLLNQ
jgi:hypothetical protein